MKKILLVATVLSHIAQFHTPVIRMLKDNGFEIHVAGKNNLSEKNGLKLENVDKIFDLPFNRSPFSTINIKVEKQLKKIISDNNYDIIQCNTPVGGIVTRLAAKSSRQKGTKVIYTAHGFHFYKGAPKFNWLLYYPIEKIFSYFTDILITINEEDYHFAIDHFKCNVEHIHGVGVSDSTFYVHNIYDQDLLRKKYQIDSNDFNIICIGELNDNKDQITLIHAINNIKNTCPHVKVLFAGNGPKEQFLKNTVTEYGLESHIRFLGYTRELANIIPACDCIVSCSKREGLPLNIIEGMLCGKPVIASNNRGHRELVKNGINGFIFKVSDAITCGEYIKLLCEDSSLYDSIANNTANSVKKYRIQEVINDIKKIYLG